MADRLKMFVFEGTPSQLAEIARGMGIGATALADTDPDAKVVAPTVADDGEKVFATTEFARLVLSRRPLSRDQKGLLVILAKAHPEWTLATKIQEALDYSPAQFAGLMGAYGRRITHTDGFVEGSWFFDAVWNYDHGCYEYRLPDSVLAAVLAENLA